jgi:hypothetical protein
MASGIEPGKAAAELFDAQLAKFQIAAVDAGDLQFNACGGAKSGGDVEHAVVVEIRAQ